MNSQHISGLFPPPRSVQFFDNRILPTPRKLNLISQANTECSESFCRGFSLPARHMGNQAIIGIKGIPLILLPAMENFTGFRLLIKADCVRVEASSPADFQYAGTTLGQLFELHPNSIPEAMIEDSPVFQTRGVMLDISRNKVPTMSTFFELIDKLAAWKINHLELYIEHTFAYSNHRAIWENSSPVTAEEIRRLDDYCQLLNIELTANQNSFGHLARWLKHPDYIHLAESPSGYVTPWGEQRTRPFSLNPLHPGSLEFLSGLYDELLPNFKSTLFNVGCDETFDLGQGASREQCEKIGKGRVYLDFLKQIKRLVEQRGKTMLFWGDIVLNHPELIPELDRNMIAIIWGYEADHPFANQCRRFAESGIPFWVCPGTSTWNSIAGRMENALANINSAAAAGKENGARGFMITEWGDNGHWQTMPFSLTALAAGAYAAWHGRAPEQAELNQLFPYADVVINLANVYLDSAIPLINNSPIFPLIRFVDPSETLNKWTPEKLRQTLRHIEQIISRLPATGQTDPSSTLFVQEISLGASMLLHAVKRGLWLKSGKPANHAAGLAADMKIILGEFKRLWLIRNREGGRSESVEPLEMRLREYEDAEQHSTSNSQHPTSN